MGIPFSGTEKGLLMAETAGYNGSMGDEPHRPREGRFIPKEGDMRRKQGAWGGIILAGFILAWCITAREGFSQQTNDLEAQGFTGTASWLKQNGVTVTQSPTQAFIYNYVVVTGEGVPAPSATSAGQKRLTAERAAVVVAYRQLAEILDGLCVTGETFVKNASVEHDQIRTAVKGFIRGAQVVHKEYNEKGEVALATVKVSMSGPAGFGTMLYEKVVADPVIRKAVVREQSVFNPPETPPVEVAHDGLIIDATAETFRPALINRIYSPKGELLYDPSRIEQKILVEYGCGEYTNRVEKARETLASRGARNPLLVKASGTAGPTDLKVTEDDALKIFAANQRSGFLSQARVAFVLK